MNYCYPSDFLSSFVKTILYLLSSSAVFLCHLEQQVFQCDCSLAGTDHGECYYLLEKYLLCLLGDQVSWEWDVWFLLHLLCRGCTLCLRCFWFGWVCLYSIAPSLLKFLGSCNLTSTTAGLMLYSLSVPSPASSSFIWHISRLLKSTWDCNPLQCVMDKSMHLAWCKQKIVLSAVDDQPFGWDQMFPCRQIDREETLKKPQDTDLNPWDTCFCKRISQRRKPDLYKIGIPRNYSAVRSS